VILSFFDFVRKAQSPEYIPASDTYHQISSKTPYL
jgi:hypothetical protein